MSDLVNRLRSHANWHISCAGGNIPDEAATEIEAADAIERLQKELETAREDVLDEAIKVAASMPVLRSISSAHVKATTPGDVALAIRALKDKEVADV